MRSKIYKNLFRFILCLFLVSTAPNVFSQEAWVQTSVTGNVPSNIAGHTAVWTGLPLNKMIVWGGYNATLPTNVGGILDCALNTWTATLQGGFTPIARFFHTAVWTGTTMIIWGGTTNIAGTINTNTGSVYNPILDSWTATSVTGACPSARYGHTAIWTGTDMIIWGGTNGTGTYYQDGAKYNPITNTWTALATLNQPTVRAWHTAVWTGSGNKMIVWGGTNGGGAQSTGWIYNSVGDNWTQMTTTGTPSARLYHTAVWTGTQMIIWGGIGGPLTNTGGIYTDATSSWAPTYLLGSCPTARALHTAVWTGSRMIVWGGFSGAYEQSGAIFDPVANNWPAVTALTSGVPTGRDYHTAVVTENQMIIWGGTITGGPSFTNTGAIYTNPPVIGITQTGTEIPKEYSLIQNYPNPFNPTTNIKFALPKSGLVKLVIYDILGNEVKTIVNEFKNAGSYTVDFDASSLSSGVYMYKITSGNFIDTKKMMLIK
jgi:hypothetical protein